MRRLLAAAALLIPAAVLVAGCSADKTPDAAGTPSAAVPRIPVPGAATTARPGDSGRQAAADAALSGNTAAICSQAAKTGSQFAATFAEDRKLLAKAGSAADKNQAAKARAKAARDVDNYSFALLDMSKLSADPVLKQALADMGRQVSAAKGEVHKVDGKKLGATLDKACGK
jgi:hypothetical protein